MAHAYLSRFTRIHAISYLHLGYTFASQVLLIVFVTPLWHSIFMHRLFFPPEKIKQGNETAKVIGTIYQVDISQTDFFYKHFQLQPDIFVK